MRDKLPLVLNIDDRHKVTLQVQGDRLYYKAEFLMDSQEWVITETYNLTKEWAGTLAFAIIDKANEIDGPDCRRPRRVQ